ncbi:Carbapenem-hydrolyzing beta-lactamase BlaB-1 precursor [Pseudoalteromonas sp. P1-9]|uniref:MBL fold metallo-hydrolase n=1 Tax=Pseudoalteromonas sp. P1-9 TaxID=1710354 RepID=UPI0006D60523|nr:MBL fold metallo-hydrolase [Pseudoalteromonas sp. P1-9]KPV97687.1 Carbapenem-hydrolyzing beta-lactamase BlaB-1 precursor [Pseudoalteromonas sp. P1-9]
MSVTSKLTTLTLTLGMISGVSAADGFDPTKPVMTELKDGVYQYSQFFYNSLVVVTDEGVIITDPSGEARSKMMRKEINKLTDALVKKVIYSHDHFDHSRGGQIFKDEGAEFITQEKCTELMSRDLENRVVQPDTTYQDSYSIKLGDKQVDLHYYGPNDGDCMSIIHMPTDNVLMGVDWHLPGYVNEPYRLTAHNYVAILNTFERVLNELEFDTVLSGHMPASSPEAFKEDYRFNKALFDAVWEGMQKGKTTEELKNTVKLPEFSHWRGYEENLPAHIERMSYSIWHGN